MPPPGLSEPAIPRYGTPNLEMLQRWLALPREQDGPFWAVNLMRYHARAQYADGRATTLTGRQADDAYAPLGPLAAIGAVPLFLADVARQPEGTPTFERVAIVRYPSRAKFFEMQLRGDFRELHAHKEAGMEFTIVFSAQPPAQLDLDRHGSYYLLRLLRFSPAARSASARQPAIVPVARLEVEGVIIGDERRWHEARIERVADTGALAGPLENVDVDVEEQIVMLLGRPELDALAGAV